MQHPARNPAKPLFAEFLFNKDSSCFSVSCSLNSDSSVSEARLYQNRATLIGPIAEGPPHEPPRLLLVRPPPPQCHQAGYRTARNPLADAHGGRPLGSPRADGTAPGQWRPWPPVGLAGRALGRLT